MKKKTRLFFPIALLAILALCVSLLAACGDEEGGGETPGGDPMTDVVLAATDFTNNAATVKVNGDRKITVMPQSSSLEITSTGAFTIKVGETVHESTDNKVTVANTSETHGTGMAFIAHADSELTLTIKLVWAKGTENNPYDVAATGETTVTVDEETWISVATAGWYKLESTTAFTLTNYSLADGGVVYLEADKYSLFEDASGTVSVKITNATSPTGYAATAARAVAALDTAEALNVYDGMTEYYFSYTVAEAGLYTVALTGEGKGGKSCFTTDAAATTPVWYGHKLAEDGVTVEACDAGVTKTIKAAANDKIAVKVKVPTAGLVGSEVVAVKVTAGAPVGVFYGVYDAVVTEVKDVAQGYEDYAPEVGYTVDVTIFADGTGRVSYFQIAEQNNVSYDEETATATWTFIDDAGDGDTMSLVYTCKLATVGTSYAETLNCVLVQKLIHLEEDNPENNSATTLWTVKFSCERTDETPAPLPTKLDIPVDSEYRGTTYTIEDTEGEIQLIRYMVEVEGEQVKTSSYFSIMNAKYDIVFHKDHEEVVFALEFVKTGEKVTAIKLWSKGETPELVDTLNYFVAAPITVPAQAGEVTITAADKNNAGNAFFKFATAGWYSIYINNSAIYGTTTDGEYYYIDTETILASNVGTAVIKVEANTVVCINAYWLNSLEIMAYSATAPVGRAEDNPIIVTDGTGVVNSPERNVVYYIKFTAATAGKYAIICPDDMATFTVNGVKYGYNPDSFGYYERIAKVDLAANESVIVSVVNTVMENDTLPIGVTLDYSVGATPLTFNNQGKANIAAAGNFTVDLPADVASLKLTGTADITIGLTGYGVRTSAAQEGTAETYVNANVLGYGFRVESSAAVAVEYVYREGSASKPQEIVQLGETADTIRPTLGTDYYVKLIAPVAGTFQISFGEATYMDNYGGGSVKLQFKKSGDTTMYGYSFDEEDWDYVANAGGETLTVTLAANAELVLIVSADTTVTNDANADVCFIRVIEPAASAVTFTGDTASVALTANTETTVTISADDAARVVTLSASAAFTVYTATDTLEAVDYEENDTYTVRLGSASAGYSIIIVSDTATTVTVTGVYPYADYEGVYKKTETVGEGEEQYTMTYIFNVTPGKISYTIAYGDYEDTNVLDVSPVQDKTDTFEVSSRFTNVAGTIEFDTANNKLTYKYTTYNEQNEEVQANDEYDKEEDSSNEGDQQGE